MQFLRNRGAATKAPSHPANSWLILPLTLLHLLPHTDNTSPSYLRHYTAYTDNTYMASPNPATQVTPSGRVSAHNLQDLGPLYPLEHQQHYTNITNIDIPDCKEGLIECGIAPCTESNAQPLTPPILAKSRRQINKILCNK